MCKKHTVRKRWNPCEYLYMVGISLDNENASKIPEVTFSIESRPATNEQREAAKRLFKRLITRVQSDIPDDKGKSS